MREDQMLKEVYARRGLANKFKQSTRNDAVAAERIKSDEKYPTLRECLLDAWDNAEVHEDGR